MSASLKVAGLSLVASLLVAAPAAAQVVTETVVQSYAVAYPWRQDVYVIAPPVMSPIVQQRVAYPDLPLVRHPETARILRRYRVVD
jgi:hypothetical protein